jgi:hypothetical protein
MEDVRLPDGLTRDSPRGSTRERRVAIVVTLQIAHMESGRTRCEPNLIYRCAVSGGQPLRGNRPYTGGRGDRLRRGRTWRCQCWVSAKSRASPRVSRQAKSGSDPLARWPAGPYAHESAGFRMTTPMHSDGPIQTSSTPASSPEPPYRPRPGAHLRPRCPSPTRTRQTPLRRRVRAASRRTRERAVRR